MPTSVEATALTQYGAPSRESAHLMFDRIAARYDLLNHLLSLGMDFGWRRRAVSELPRNALLPILDLACGTCDLAIAAQRRNRQRQIIGADKAQQMLALGAQKLQANELEARIRLVRVDGLALPLQNESVGAAMIAFGIRNMTDTVACLRELHRVTCSGGKVIVLEFSLPRNRLIRRLHRFYLRQIVPRLGRFVSGDANAYSYLNRTIETYPHGEAFCALLREAGFEHVTATPLTFGVVSLYVGTRP